MTALLAASLLSPFFVELTPEVRTTYQSLGKIVEDRPMQVTFVRAGYDTGTFGRFGVYNFDVSSMTDRRSEDHRHMLYHTEYGPLWGYDIDFNGDWTLKSDVMSVWTLYRGWENEASNGEFWWFQVAQSLENPYLVPYYRMRQYVSGSHYLWFEIGLRRKFRFLEDFYLQPAVYIDGGDNENYQRVIGNNVCGNDWGGGGVSSITFRLEAGWEICSWATLFAYVEQYEVTGHDARTSNAASSNEFAHNDWTLGGIGLRMRF